MKIVIYVLALLCASVSSFAQDTTSFKKIIAERIAEPIKIDAVLSEASWMNAQATNGLTTNQPTFGAIPSQPTDIKMLYDDGAVYVSAMLYDSAPDSIPAELRERDQIGNADWFGVFFSPYQDGINGNGFIVSSAGVQFDAQYTTFGEDSNWDAVWESQIQIVENGWVVEMRIPYSMLRFPKQEIQQWDINFGRQIQRLGEKSFWSPIDPQQDGFLNQFGQVEGIKDIDSPVRLSATPFVVGYAQHYSDETDGGWGQSFNAGMDIKYGINDAFTLDMTLIPDFGEARSDNQVLNLSPFEQRFDENRQFFTEGVELFNKGGLFYSRRIGGYVHNRFSDNDLAEGETIINNPQKAQLLNASKVSGRTKSGLGIGVFNAIENRSFATIENELGEQREVETHPLTNYNVLALDQNLKNNSFVTLINTNVTRFGDAYDANVTGAVFELRNKDNSYSINGTGSVSQIQRTGEKVDLGHAYYLNAGKTNGNWQWRVGYSEETDDYNINDLGFLFNNNERSVWGNLRYSRYEPIGPFNSIGGGVYMQHERLYRPNVATENGVNFWAWAQTKNLWYWNIFNYTTTGDMYDYFGPRTEGRYYTHPGISNTGFFIRSDSRKSFFFSVNGGHRAIRERERNNSWLGADLTYRMSDRLSFGVGTYKDWDFKDVDFATFDAADEIVYGQRDVNTFVNNVNIKFTPNTQMNFTFRLRHYWSHVHYFEYYDLMDDGTISPRQYDENLDTSYDAFTIDAIYRWRFAPGSDIFLVWKNSIFDYQEAFVQDDYFAHVGNLFERPQTNSLSLKVIYFLDYLEVKNKVVK
jgi:hypothetical protein